MTDEQAIAASLPLTETTYFILLSLSPGPRHGYSIMKDVRQLSGERVVLSTGTLYSALKRLLDLEWIKRTDDPTGSRGQKDYVLSELGQQILQAELKRLHGLVQAALSRPLGNPI